MKASLLAVAVLATIAISSAVDEECVQRKLRGLPIHWPNPTDCASFYRCTNKNVKRELLCPAGKEYNPLTGRCANLGKNLCKLSLKAPLAGSTNPCADAVAGSFVAEEGSCRSFNICNNNMAYPQTCDEGSYFNTADAACEPDTETTCWENLCLSKANGDYLPNADDCHSFYICAGTKVIAQQCPEGSYFNAQDLNCQPGQCPSDGVTTTTLDPACTDETTPLCTDEVTTPSTPVCTDEVTTPSTPVCTDAVTTPSTTACTEEITTPSTVACTDKVTTTTICTTTPICTDEITTPTTCTDEITTPTTCTDEITTPTTCTDEITTPTTCTDEITTPTTCTDEITTPTTCTDKITTPTTCTDDITTPSTVVCTDEITTPTTCTDEITTPTTCTDEITTPTTCTDEITTPSTLACTDETPTCVSDQYCDCTKCLNAADDTIFPALNTNTGFCSCLNKKPIFKACPDDSIFEESIHVCLAQNKVCPSSNCKNKPDFTLFPATNTTKGYCKCLSGEASYENCPESDYVFNTELLICVQEEDCTTPSTSTPPTTDEITTPSTEACTDETPTCVSDETCDCTKCLNAADNTVFPALNTDTGFCKCSNNKPVFTQCPDDYIFEQPINVCVAQNKICPSSNCVNKPDYTLFPATNTDKGYCKCLDGKASYEECPDTDYTFDSVTLICVKSSDDCEEEPSTPSPVLCEGGLSEGDFAPNPSNCMLFYICFDGELVESSCETGNYYNDASKECMADVDGKCPQCTAAADSSNRRNKRSAIAAPTCVEGSITCHPTDCDKYYVCNCDGQQILQECGVNNYFNPATQKCQPDTNNVCWPKSDNCTCTDGELTPIPSECYKYNVCVGGQQVERQCTEGWLFNPITLQCEVDSNNVCWPKSDDCCTEGEFSPIPSECYKYNVCVGGQEVEHECTEGWLFNPITLQCEVDTNNVCWPKPDDCCTEGEFSPIPSECYKYYVCVGGQEVERECIEGSWFNPTTLRCEVDTNNVCWPKPDDCCTEGDFSPIPSECYKYFVCVGGQEIERECIEGSWFNPTTLRCEVDTNNVCWPKSDNCTCTDGEFSPIPSECYKYNVCVGGQQVERQCTEGWLFNPITLQCEVDSNNVCWPKSDDCCTEGEFSPIPSECYKYNVCVGGQEVEHECTEGWLFNPITLQCEVDTNNVCWPKPDDCCTEGEFSPIPSECYKYYVCVGGQEVERECIEGSWFNPTTLRCEVDTNNVCWPKPDDCCTEGDFSPIPSECYKYFVCVGGQEIERECIEGSWFNPTTLRCEVDTNNVCWPKSDNCTCTDGEFSPIPSECYKYNVCVGGQQIERECIEGSWFNPATLRCEVDTNNVCWPKSDNCTCTDGEFSPIPLECYKYNVCVGGQQIERECIQGSFFNPLTLQCQLDTNNVCWPKTDCTCPGGYVDGEISPHPTDCHKYYICTNGEQIVHECGENNYFNPDTECCQPDVNNECWPKPECTCPGGYQDGEFSPHPNPLDCNKYFICTDGKQVLHECGENNYFNNKTLECELDTDKVCAATVTCTCPGGYEEGQFSPHPNASLCDKFYICVGGKQVLQECGTNQYFNNQTLECEEDTKHVCWPNLCAGQINGELIANPRQCNAYFMCEGQNQLPEVCADGQWFDPSKSSCQPDVDAVCYNPCANNQTINLLPHPDCTKYYFCNGPQTIVGTCQVGGFDSVSGVCNSTKVCPGNECVGKYDGYAYADPDDNTKFYVCMNGVPMPKECPPNHAYNPNVANGICLPVANPNCDPTPCLAPDFNQAYQTLNKSANEFCYCKNGIPLINKCQDDMLFNNAIGACYSNAPCDPTICPDSDDYTVSPNRNDTQSFCLCVTHVPVIVQCPNNGTFNPFTLLCSDVEISSQCNQFECINQADNYKFNALNETANGFCLCKDHVATFVPCAEDSTYNPIIGICIQADINCNSKQCVGLADNTKIPALTTTEGYCECVNDKATFINCPDSGEFDALAQDCIIPVCNQDTCATLNNYGTFPASNTTTGFCICINNVAEYRNCPNNQEFNTAAGVCRAKLQNCDNAMCDGLADGTTLPALYTLYGFCLCINDEAIYEDCPANHVFSTEKGVCLVDTEALCGSSAYCDECTISYSCSSYAAANTTSGFCICGNSGPQFVDCPAGYLFNGQICHETAQSNCDIALCKSATLENPITSPALNGNTSFCYCTGPDDVMLLNCPAGKYYNNELSLCVSIIEESCSCPNGTQNGEIVPDTTTCNKYFQCLNGVMHEQICAEGEYFNAVTLKCCIDTEGICSNKSECTCLGAYHEGERIEHPVNAQIYYVCQNSKLFERNCGVGRLFSKSMNQCIKAPRLNNHFPQKRSVDSNNNDHEEFFCIENEKRSVPSNCSQYEQCINQSWKRRTCTNYRYYNPEQQKCLEPRDDLVCSYAKLTTLPTCNAEMEQRVHKGKTCQQYYRCQKGKWRLKSCGKQQYFHVKLSTCVAIPLQDKNFQCETLGNETAISSDYPQEIASTCHQLSVREYAQHCAMYLMCLNDNWWYQYCPSGMYFNRSLNYCIPDLNQECPEVSKTKELVVTEEFSNDICLQDGLLRPSALACNRYFICIESKWQMQHCSQDEFYDVSNAKCSLDSDGICSQLKMDCFAEEKRISFSNCSCFEQCSDEGKWLKKECPFGQGYDDLLKECVVNNGICSDLGFKRACKPQETKVVMQNCSMFYYCSQESWQVGACLKGFMYSAEENSCVPHSLEDKCKAMTTHNKVIARETDSNLCLGQLDGVSVAHTFDCTRFYICIQEQTSQEMQCSKGSYFETSLGYCRPNDGTCRLPLTGACENATDNSLVAHPSDCQSYYKCSTINGTELLKCPDGEYYHKFIRQCRIDHGECKQDLSTKCFGLQHGTKLAHEMYCNIYYACVKGLAIPVECPENNQFNPILGKCVYDENEQCQDGQLVDGNQTYSCGNIADGSYLPDLKDCTRYYICSKGQATPKKCSGSTYFDSQLLLCVPDDGSCPFVDDDEGQNTPVAPDPIVCEGRHGFLMPDPFNCNNFYACVHSKLKHERCYDNQFFNKTSVQCQLKPTDANKPGEGENDESPSVDVKSFTSLQCLDEPTTIDKLCLELPEGTTLAEQGDCRRYVTCRQEEEEEPLSQRCRNGESYDSLLGFCRQNDGTCLMENGQRLGECSDKHGQLTRDANSCRSYFTCINGQKIAQNCQEDEYFSKAVNMCVKDTLQTCSPTQIKPDDAAKQSCTGLSESILYPYISDNCRSYFQCIKGVPKVHKCADDLYFDPITIKCVKNQTECLMPAQTQRSPQFAQKFSKLCSQKEYGHPYVNLENECRSFYICHSTGEVTHELCPLGLMFNKNFNVCMPEHLVMCN